VRRHQFGENDLVKILTTDYSVPSQITATDMKRGRRRPRETRAEAVGKHGPLLLCEIMMNHDRDIQIV